MGIRKLKKHVERMLKNKLPRLTPL